MGKENIQVGVRVRPFLSHEDGEECIVSMSKASVTLKDIEEGESNTFKYNYCFWSHDAQGGRKLFTNDHLYVSIGTQILNNSYEGYNSTVFAYGQTGSGKSYSIEGAPCDNGLLQRT